MYSKRERKTLKKRLLFYELQLFSKDNQTTVKLIMLYSSFLFVFSSQSVNTAVVPNYTNVGKTF